MTDPRTTPTIPPVERRECDAEGAAEEVPVVMAESRGAVGELDRSEVDSTEEDNEDDSVDDDTAELLRELRVGWLGGEVGPAAGVVAMFVEVML